MEGKFQFPEKGMTGVIDVRPRDPSDPEVMPYIIRTSDPFEIVVDWSLGGPTASCLGGEWDLCLYIDDVDGSGMTHGKIAETKIDVGTVAPHPLPRAYTHTFEFPPRAVAEGVYQIIAVLRYFNLGVQLQIQGFAETGVIDFTNA